MDWKSTSNNFYSIIKVISIVFITSAIALEIFNIYALFTNSKIPSSVNTFLWIGRFAITAHFIEAMIAAFYAPSREKMPIKYGIYTFFVGTVGLLELFRKNDEQIINKQ
jgi:hypothetical protein